MNQVNSEGKYQPSATLPCIPTPVYQQQSSRNQCYGFIQSPVKYLPERTPQPPPGSHQYYGESMSCTQQYCMPQHPVGYSLDGRVRYRDTLARPMARPQKNDRPTTLPGAAGDLTACQLQHPNSSLPRGVTGDSGHCSQEPAEEGLQKRELRLMKNREAARECRRKKKDYVKCLENRVVVLENQNKTLIEELKTLKDIYRHKVEEAARECRKRKKEYMDHLQTRNTLLETENEQLRAQVKHLYNHNH